MWQLIKRELRDHKWSLLAFLVGSFLLLWMYVATFDLSAASMEQLKQLVKTYPKALLEAIGLNDFNIDTLEKYLNVKHFSLIWPLLAIILALSRAGNALAGNIQDGTMGLSLSLPIKRLKIFASKYSAGLITILIFTGVSVFGVIPLAIAYNIPYHPRVLFEAWMLTILLMWTVYSLAIMVSAAVSDKTKVYGIMSSAMLVTYSLYIMAAINPSWSSLKYYSLFYYFDTAKVLAGNHISLSSLLVFGILIIGSAAVAAWRFDKRDIMV